MSTENEKRLDDLFKKKLDDPVDEIRYEEGDWEALEQMLDKPKRKRIVYLLPFLSAAAAVLLVFLGWWALKPKTGNQPDKNIAHTSHKTTDTIIDKNVIAGTKIPDTIMDKTHHIAGKKLNDTIIDKNQAVVGVNRAYRRDTIMDRARVMAHKKAIPVESNVPPILGPVKKADKATLAQSQNVIRKDTIMDKAIKNGKTENDVIAANQLPVTNPAQNTTQPAAAPSAATSAGLAANSQPVKPKVKPQMAYHPLYTLSVVAAPDLNGVNSFSQGKVGTNIGLTFAVGLSRKLTVTTGVLYSVKPYLTNFSSYSSASGYQFPTNPQTVTADCRMLDIPLNIGYQVYHKQRNSISVGTGLSSYLMLHESYKFTYQQQQHQYGNSAAAAPSNYTVANPGQYFFGVMNFNATYEHQLSSKVGISIQPYLKVPLSNVGYSQVKLQSTGVAVGLNWNLNSLKKP